MSAVGVTASTAPYHGARPGSTPRAALHKLRVMPVSISVARGVIEKHHYLHSLPGGTKMALGVMAGERLVGALTLGVGPYNAPSLVEGAHNDDYLALTRLWLSDELPYNSESRVLGVLLRALRRHTNLKFLVTYADPAQGHLGLIYQATNWVYTGLSQATPLYDLGDGLVFSQSRRVRIEATHLGSGVLGSETPVDGGSSRVALRLIGADVPL